MERNARKSSKDEKTGDDRSVAHQTKSAREYAAKKGWRIDDRYVFSDDGISGAEFVKRPGLNKLRQALKAPKFGVLIVTLLDRLGRPEQVTRLMQVILEIDDADVRLVECEKDHEITSADEVLTFLAAHAAGQSRINTGLQVHSKHRAKAKRGEWTGGKIPYGYTLKGAALVKGVRVPGNLVIDPKQAKIVRRIFKRALDVGCRRIARELSADGIATQSGNRHWQASQVYNILKNPIYHGVKVWGLRRTVKRGGTSRRIKADREPERVPIEHLRIIPEKLWLAVQERMRDEKAARNVRGTKIGQRRSGQTAGKHLLSKLLQCGVCGGSMFRPSSRAEYRCVNYHNGACPNSRRLRQDAVEKAILLKFEDVLVSKIVMTQLEEFLHEIEETAPDPAPLRKEQESIRKQIRHLVDSVADGDGNIAAIQTGIREREARLEHLDGQLKGLTAVKEYDLKDFADRITPVLKDWQGHLKKNPEVAQAVLRNIVPNRIVVTPLRPEPGQKSRHELRVEVDYGKVLEQAGLNEINAAIRAALVDPSAFTGFGVSKSSKSTSPTA